MFASKSHADTERTLGAVWQMAREKSLPGLPSSELWKRSGVAEQLCSKQAHGFPAEVQLCACGYLGLPITPMLSACANFELQHSLSVLDTGTECAVIPAMRLAHTLVSACICGLSVQDVLTHWRKTGHQPVLGGDRDGEPFHRNLKVFDESIELGRRDIEIGMGFIHGIAGVFAGTAANVAYLLHEFLLYSRDIGVSEHLDDAAVTRDRAKRFIHDSSDPRAFSQRTIKTIVMLRPWRSTGLYQDQARHGDVSQRTSHQNVTSAER